MKQHGVATLVELGAGKVLTGLARRIDPELSAWRSTARRHRGVREDAVIG
jgi:malonyl CoA-acyl carrier protein transacylase